MIEFPGFPLRTTQEVAANCRHSCLTHSNLRKEGEEEEGGGLTLWSGWHKPQRLCRKPSKQQEANHIIDAAVPISIDPRYTTGLVGLFSPVLNKQVCVLSQRAKKKCLLLP
jgi:hypothetical protein